MEIRNDNNDNIRVGVISVAGGGAETSFQQTMGFRKFQQVSTLSHSTHLLKTNFFRYIINLA